MNRSSSFTVDSAKQFLAAVFLVMSERNAGLFLVPKNAGSRRKKPFAALVAVNLRIVEKENDSLFSHTELTTSLKPLGFPGGFL
jgi:hypothetical protein